VLRPRAAIATRPATAFAVACVVAVLGLTGCSVKLAAGGTSKSHAKTHSKHHARRHSSHHPKRHPGHHKAVRARRPGRHSVAPDTLVIEPRAGFSVVYRMINASRRSIDITMYEFADTTAEHALAAAAGRGVDVRVILDQRQKSLNSAAYRYLTSHRVKVVWSSSRFDYTHQKTLVSDQSKAIIMTANLTSAYYKTSRDFLVIDTAKADVAAIVRVFDADFAHRPIRPGDGRDLVWSPTDSQRQILGVINGARKSLRIYSEEMADTTVDNALISAAKRGVDVSICGENTGGQYDAVFARLARAGVHVSYYSSYSGFYIHGKVVEADYGTDRGRSFIGSENFSPTSLDRNRELGLITSNPAVLAAIARTFAGDFKRGKHVHS
jgi:phosphatidylserine/phosphatidylglycerophosphate/cardiolipin synthase-like enzyme